MCGCKQKHERASVATAIRWVGESKEEAERMCEREGKRNSFGKRTPPFPSPPEQRKREGVDGKEKRARKGSRERDAGEKRDIFAMWPGHGTCALRCVFCMFCIHNCNTGKSPENYKTNFSLKGNSKKKEEEKWRWK